MLASSHPCCNDAPLLYSFLTSPRTPLSGTRAGRPMFSSTLLDVPRPFVDPVNSLVEAVGLTSLAVHRPRRCESVVLCLDSQRRAVHMFNAPSMSVATVHCIIAHASLIPACSSVVICSIRTGQPIHHGDINLWHTSADVLHNAGLHLYDWVVIGAGGLYCPRTVSHASDPWPYGSTYV